jgi:plastocyanin
VRIAGVVMPVMIAMLLLFAGSPRVTATDQPSAANVAVKIDNFVFGPQTITVPVATTVTWTNSDDIPHIIRP